MLGSKKGLRDIDRGVSDIRKGVVDIRAAFSKDPAEKVRLLQQQRDQHLAEATRYRQKARGLLNGPARLRMAEAAEASAQAAQDKIDAVRQKHGLQEGQE